jgi:hypothetical protein
MSGEDRAGSDRRRRLLLAALALLVVLGLALGAASLDEVHLSSAGGTSGYDADEPVQIGDTQRAPHSGGATNTNEIPFWFFVSVYVLGVFATVALAWRRDVQTVWLAMTVLIAVFVLLTFLGGMGGYDFATNSSAQVSEVPNDSQLGSGTGTEPNNSPPASALPTAALVFIGFLLGMVALLSFSRGSTQEEEDDGDEEPADAATVASIGAAAGRAADRIEGSTGDNAVYEAWRDMRAALEDEEDPTLTPAEFRDRAIAAGIPPGPAGELTAVFREVRYGHEPATESRVAAAEAALREVEAVAEDVTAEGDGEAPDSREPTDDSPGATDTHQSTGEGEDPADPTGSAAGSGVAGDEP